MTPSHRDTVTGISSVNSPQMGGTVFDRVTAKALLHRYHQDWLGADHHFKFGTQFERGEHRSRQALPGGVQFLDRSGAPSQRVSRDAMTTGGRFVTAAGFASDSISISERITADAGLRFDHSRAISQDLGGVDVTGRPTDGFTAGAGTLYTWNVVSPRLGVTAKLDRDGRTVLRANYGRFNQGVLTGELEPFHPGVTTITTMEYEAATQDYTKPVSVVDPNINLVLDRDTRTPHTDEFSLALDHQVAPRLAASVAYIRKRGTDYIGWIDTGGTYSKEERKLADGTVLPVENLTNTTADRRFFLTNPDDLFLEYDGLVVALRKAPVPAMAGLRVVHVLADARHAGVEQCTAAEAQFSTIARPTSLTFGQDPNDLDECHRAAPQRPAARLPRDGCRARAVGPAGRRQPAAFQRPALGGQCTGPAEPEQRPANPDRAARIAPDVVAITARSSSLEDARAWGVPGPSTSGWIS